MALIAVFWIRSFSGSDHFVLFLHSAMPQQSVSWRGQIKISLSNHPLDPNWSWTAICRTRPIEQNTRGEFFEPEYDDPVVLTNIMWSGFAFSRSISSLGNAEFANWDFAVPYWLPLCGTMWRIAVRTRQRLLLNRRRSRGMCLCCGYDLRSSPDRCPECGAKAASSTVV